MRPDDGKGPASAGPLFERTAAGVRLFCGAILVALVGMVCLEALLRGVFAYSLGFAEELTGYCVVALTFAGAALALRGDALFQVHFLLDAWPEGVRRWLVRLFAIGALIVCVILAWKTRDLAFSSLSRGKFAPTVLRTPLWIPQILPPAGFALIGFFLVEKLLLTFRRPGGDA